MSEASRDHPKDPLHGVTLETIVRTLQEKYGWEEMGHRIRIRCFQDNPSIKSSLTFLRKTPWAREKVEGWYLWELRTRRLKPRD
jgi:uncharacterized protein (DUF2132 family)